MHNDTSPLSYVTLFSFLHLPFLMPSPPPPYSWSPHCPMSTHLIFHHLSFLPYIILSSLPTIMPPFYPIPSPFCSPPPFHLILYHSLLFIHYYLFPSCRAVPTLLMPLNPFHPFLFINHLFLLAHAIVSSLSTINPPHYPGISSPLLPVFLSFYFPSSFPFMSLFLIPDHPLIPYHSIFFIFLSSFLFTHIIPSSLSTIIYPLYPLPSLSFIYHHPFPLYHVIPFFYYPSSFPIIPCHPLFFILCHSPLYSVIPSSLFFTNSESLSHIITSSLLTIISPLYFTPSPLYSPITHLPYPISFLLFIQHHLSLHFMSYPVYPHHSLYPMSSSLLYFPSPLLLLISFTPPFIPYPLSFLYCHLLVFISYQPLPFIALLYLIFPFWSPLRASQLTRKILREKKHTAHHEYAADTIQMFINDEMPEKF